MIIPALDPPPPAREPLVDAHTHIFCWGENPGDGFLSERTRRAWTTRLVMVLSGVSKEPVNSGVENPGVGHPGAGKAEDSRAGNSGNPGAGDTLSAKMRRRLLRELRASWLDYAVVLAQDAVYRADGSRDDAATHFYVANDYVLNLARECPKIIPGCSINPCRRDALAELERCRAAGVRLVKIHTAIQGVDPARADFDPFYRRAQELGVVLMFHTGYEHSCKVVSQHYTDPRRLARPLDHGGLIIAAHCGTCGFFDREDYYPRFIEMMRRYDNLYGDTAIMASLIRWRSLWRLSRESDSIRQRIIHGSDYPFPPARLPYLFRTGLRPTERKNPLDMDLRIKQTFAFGPHYTSLLLNLLGRA